MKLLHKTGLTLTAFLLSAVLTSTFAAESATDTENAQVSEAAPVNIVGSWRGVKKMGPLNYPTSFSFLKGGVLLVSERLKTIVPQPLLINEGKGAWKQNEDGSINVRYFRSLYWESNGAYYDDEETTGTLSLDTDGNLRGNLSIGMMNPDNTGIIPDMGEISFSATKVTAD